jgi:flagellar M-ring protein FliF
LVNHLTSRKNKELTPINTFGSGTTAAAGGALGQSNDAAVLESPAAAMSGHHSSHSVAGQTHSIELPQVGSEFAEQVSHLHLLANRESDRVTAVIKYWIERGVAIEYSAVKHG